MTSFKATNTQNVPVFFHAFNNEIQYWISVTIDRGLMTGKGISASKRMPYPHSNPKIVICGVIWSGL
jgi:hypothetical protein